MNNNKFNTLNDREWLRLTGTGIKKSTFNKMLDILKVAEIEKFKKGGKTNKLSLENRLFDDFIILTRISDLFSSW
ncbi:hypothetical protein [Spiroplasma poulsonii]|uniref:hypothetical protein n=1 Tax=Spiroplasma poulsonii TaxID=2138 RepID=UPI0026B5BC26